MGQISLVATCGLTGVWYGLPWTRRLVSSSLLLAKGRLLLPSQTRGWRCGENEANLRVIWSPNRLTLEIKSDSYGEGTGFLASWEEVGDAPREDVDGEYMIIDHLPFFLSHFYT